MKLPLMIAIAGMFLASLTPARSSQAAPLPEEQDGCLEAAAQTFAAARTEIEQKLRSDLDKCDGPSTGDFADKCYAIAARRFEAASSQAEAHYSADQAACLR